MTQARLQNALSGVDRILTDVQRSVGDNLYVKTFHHGLNGHSGEQVVTLKAQIAYAKKIMDSVK